MVSIALDFDGVIADQEKKKAKVLIQQFGISDNLAPLLNFTIFSKYSLQDYLGLSKTEYAELQDKFFNDLSDVLPVKGAIEGISSLKHIGYDLCIVTYRKERTAIPKWLEYYGIDLPVIYPKLGDDVPSVDYMLDDTPSKLATLDSKINIQAYLLSSPKNQGCLDVKSRFIRVETWETFLSTVDFGETKPEYSLV